MTLDDEHLPQITHAAYRSWMRFEPRPTSGQIDSWIARTYGWKTRAMPLAYPGQVQVLFFCYQRRQPDPDYDHGGCQRGLPNHHVPSWRPRVYNRNTVGGEVPEEIVEAGKVELTGFINGGVEASNRGWLLLE
ncbi:MAG: hypothetical protein AAGA23_05145 [Pseudomonadota bacterium]